VLFGPTMKRRNVAVSARINATKKGAALSDVRGWFDGQAGYRAASFAGQGHAGNLQGRRVRGEVPFDGSRGEWTMLHFQTHEGG